ncbi:divalent-cation tolerance protein CutA [Amycolatopsis sp. GM8]|uniref:divalent-cation tolerance protein CutA n=1 Tax=Amycolatopsis sp. GM8 TaxID=2896530 RepID=UPI001F46B599|nr:divalent-cation tolerance protein CutA [Amycolatopsis sp. GM8]
MSDHIIVTTTTDSEDAARNLAAQAVADKLGACAQIVGPITSVYSWEGRVRIDSEWRVEVKTAADRVPDLVALLKSVHSYDVPEIIAVPIEGGSAEYLDWLVAETR